MAYPIASMADGRVRMSDGTIQEAPNTFSSGAPISNINPKSMPQAFPSVFPKVGGFSAPQQQSAGMSVAPQEPQQTQQPIQQEPQQPQEQEQEIPEVIQQAASDIIAGMPINELEKYYPQLKGTDTTGFKQLSYDVQGGASQDQIMQAYPEFFAQQAPQQGQSPIEQPQEASQEEQSFVGGVWDKTKDSFMGGIDRIQQAGEDVASGDKNFGEGAIRGAAGALETFFSPISGIVGQTAQEGFEEFSPETQKQIIDTAKSAYGKGKEVWDGFDPETQRFLGNVGVSGEVLANFVGAGAATKAVQGAKTGVPGAVQGAIQGAKASIGTQAAKVPGVVERAGERLLTGVQNVGSLRNAERSIRLDVETGLPIIGEIPSAPRPTEVKTGIGKKTEEIFDNTIASVDLSKKAAYQSNPYQKEYFDEMLKKAESGEGIDDIKGVQDSMYAKIADDIEKKVAEKASELSENSPVYRTIRELPTEVQADEVLQGFRKNIEDSGLIIEDGIVRKNPSIQSTGIAPSDMQKVNDLYQGILSDSSKKGGVLSASDMLDSRHNIDKLISYDRIMSSDKGQNLLRSMRRGLDTIAKRDIPGLAELDANYVDKLGEFGDATRDLVYKQGDVKGEFRSNLHQIIATINNPNRALLKERIGEILPDMPDRVQAIRNLSELHKSLTTPFKGKYVDAGGGFAAGAVTGFAVGGPLGAIAGSVIGGLTGAFVESGLGKLKIKRLTDIVNNMSESGVKRLAEINEKIAKNAELKQNEKQMMQNLKNFVNDKKTEVTKKSVLMLEAPKAGSKARMLSSRKPNVINAKPIIVGPKGANPSEITSRSKIVQPSTNAKLKDVQTPARELADKVKNERKVAEFVYSAKQATGAARYGGSGEDRLLSAVESAYKTGNMTKPESLRAIEIFIDEIESAKKKEYSYMSENSIEKLLNLAERIEKGDVTPNGVASATKSVDTQKSLDLPTQKVDAKPDVPPVKKAEVKAVVTKVEPETTKAVPKPAETKAKFDEKPTEGMTEKERIQYELDKKQAQSEFKDVNDRIAGSRKEKAQYSKLSMEQYKKVEAESPALANDLVTKERVLATQYEPKVAREAGEDAGLAGYKDRLLSAIAKKPDTGKEFREAYVQDMPEMYRRIAEAKSFDDIKEIASEFTVMRSTRGADAVLFREDGKYFPEKVFGKRFLDLLVERTDGAKAIRTENLLRSKYTPEMRSSERSVVESKAKEMQSEMNEKIATTDWASEAKRIFQYNQNYFSFKLGRRITNAELRNPPEQLLKDAGEVMRKTRQGDADYIVTKKLKSFDEDPTKTIRDEDWSFVDGEKKTVQRTETGKPKIHGGSKIDKVERTGGREVSDAEVGTPDNIVKDFGYKSVQFGNYMNDADSQASVKRFIESMKDLEDATGIDIKALNSKEGLSIAFGARGQGGNAAAHYEPTYNIINLTKSKGNGTVAHEFGHFLDYTAGKSYGLKDGEFNQALSKKQFSPLAEGLEKATKELMDTIKGVGQSHEREVIVKPLAGSSYYPSIKSKYAESGYAATLEYLQNRPMRDKDRVKMLRYLARLEGGPIKVNMTVPGSRFFEDAKDLGEYWKRDVELLARSFEAYIQDTLRQKNIRSNYLVSDGVEFPHGEYHTYPQGTERDKINKAFEKWVEEFKKKTETGKNAGPK